MHTAIQLPGSFDRVCAGVGGDAVPAARSVPASRLCRRSSSPARLRDQVARASDRALHRLRGCPPPLSAMDEQYRSDASSLRGSRRSTTPVDVDDSNWLQYRLGSTLSWAVLPANSDTWPQELTAHHKQHDPLPSSSAFGRGLCSPLDLFNFRPAGPGSPAKMDADGRKYSPPSGARALTVTRQR